jgi:hypothetical protein
MPDSATELTTLLPTETSSDSRMNPYRPRVVPWMYWIALVVIAAVAFGVKFVKEQSSTFQHNASNKIVNNNMTVYGSFPTDFVWGVATSSYQIEGAVNEDNRGPTIWDTFVHIPGTIMDGTTGDVADNHYHLYKDDIKLMKSLNIQAYRFSIAWSRILPNGRGPVNEAGIRFYDELIDELLQQKIEPWITLFHWDLPQGLQDEFNGWLDIRIVDCFVDYARIIFKHFGHKVKRFITLNEPWT